MKVSSLPILTFLPASLATTIYLAGDSTMASGGGGSDTAGWGDYVAQYLSSSSGITVSNQAVAGRSARSYTREGRFDDIASTLEAGDYVIIEFGHNDGGTLSSTSDNGRTDCSGTGSEVCYSEYDGVNETILTFPAYIENASNTFKKIGATVIISSQTPNNPWETGSFVDDPPRFVGYAEIAADAADTSYVNHFDYTDQVYEALGADTVDAYFPIDHTHTSAAGANVVAKAFLRGVVCGKLSLADELVTDDLELDEYECLDE